MITGLGKRSTQKYSRGVEVYEITDGGVHVKPGKGGGKSSRGREYCTGRILCNDSSFHYTVLYCLVLTYILLVVPLYVIVQY